MGNQEAKNEKQAEALKALGRKIGGKRWLEEGAIRIVRHSEGKESVALSSTPAFAGI
jgi:hypothetical protein